VRDADFSWTTIYQEAQRKGSPERSPRRLCENRAAAGVSDCANYCWGAGIPLCGCIFPSEGTAQPCAVPRDFTAARMGWGFASGLVRLLAEKINHSRRRLSCIPSRKVIVAPV